MSQNDNPTPIQNRYDFVFLFDVRNGNPNGNPDAGNQPRMDMYTNRGLVTDVALKRKVRRFVEETMGEDGPYEIYAKDGVILNDQHQRPYEELKLDDKLAGIVEVARQWMCQNFYDVRAFGAVMTTGKKDKGEKQAGQVRGPIQLVFGESIEPIHPQMHSITRNSVTNVDDEEKERTIGRKYTIPYALYRTHGFISVPCAEKSGFSETDLAIFWNALLRMFELDRSAARGEMIARGLYIFKHNSRLGNAPSHKLFERIDVRRKDDTIKRPASGFGDYVVDIDQTNLPAGVELIVYDDSMTTPWPEMPNG